MDTGAEIDIDRKGSSELVRELAKQLAAKQQAIDRLILEMSGKTTTPTNTDAATNKAFRAMPDDDDILMDMPTDEGVGAQHGLQEIPGGIGVDSCASANVMARWMLPGYKVESSEGSRRGQKWGSASGHSIYNEGQVMYKFMDENGQVKKGSTQVGDVRRPLAAVSQLTNNNQIGFFCKGEDWLLDRRDPLVPEIIRLVQMVQRKTKLYEHRGTYRMRAWMIPGEDGEQTGTIASAKGDLAPFGRQGR